jgi:hypothetical protein
MYITVIRERTCLIECETVGLTNDYIAAIPNAAIAGDSVGGRIVIRPSNGSPFGYC